MSLVLIAFLVSIAAGGFGALVGIGGGLIIVPVLTVLLDVPIKTAIAASLIGVIATSMSASAHYLDSGIADRRLGLLLLLGRPPGASPGACWGASSMAVSWRSSSVRCSCSWPFR